MSVNFSVINFKICSKILIKKNVYIYKSDIFQIECTAFFLKAIIDMKKITNCKFLICINKNYYLLHNFLQNFRTLCIFFL